MRMLFDGSILRAGCGKNAARSGIFVVASELLRTLVQKKDMRISLYVEANAWHDVSRFIASDDKLCRLPIVNKAEFGLSSFLYGKIEARPFIFPERVGVYAILRNVYRMLRWMALGALKVPMAVRVKMARALLVKARISENDVFLSPVFLPPPAVANSGLRRFTILYDTIPLLFPQFYQDARGVMWTTRLVDGLRQDDYGFAISLATKLDFLKLSRSLREEHVTVIPLAAAERFYVCQDKKRISQVREKYHIPAGVDYMLSLCTLEPRKNIPFAVRAFVEMAKTHPNVCFVLAGGKWRSFEPVLRELLEDAGELRERIVLTGYVDDEDLAALYSGALSFVYLSIYEGFGLPPLEAMQCGCPVLTSNTSSLPEVVGDAGLMVAPDDLDGAVSAMTRLVEDDSLRAELRQKGLERCKLFSWDKAAEIIVDTMKKTLEIKG